MRWDLSKAGASTYGWLVEGFPCMILVHDSGSWFRCGHFVSSSKMGQTALDWASDEKGQQVKVAKILQAAGNDIVEAKGKVGGAGGTARSVQPCQVSCSFFMHINWELTITTSALWP